MRGKDSAALKAYDSESRTICTVENYLADIYNTAATNFKRTTAARIPMTEPYFVTGYSTAANDFAIYITLEM